MMEFTIGSLSNRGLKEFTEFLEEIENGSTNEPPYYLLETHSKPIDFSNGQVKISTDKEISTRMDLGGYLSRLISTSEDLSMVLDDRGASAFLSLAFFDMICKRNADGRWQIAQRNRYLADPRDRYGFDIYRRNIVCASLAIYHYHGANSRLLLSGPSYEISEYMEQVAAREEVLMNKSLVKVMDRLYWDTKNSIPKTGQRTSDGVPDGALRRFLGPGSFFEQYKQVYDFWSMTAEEIIDILPNEFSDWLNPFDSNAL